MERTPEQIKIGEEQKAEMHVLHALRGEIREMKEAETEKEKRGEKYDPHFKEIDPANLLLEDLRIYRKFKEGLLEEKEIKEWMQKIVESKDDKKSAALYHSREVFVEWIINKAMPVVFKTTKSMNRSGKMGARINLLVKSNTCQNFCFAKT